MSDVTPMMRTCSWSLYALTDDTIFIVDDNLGGMSITNAAELVCRQCVDRFGSRKIVYRDSMGRWDRLYHVLGNFKGFGPYDGAIPPQRPFLIGEPFP